LSYVPPSLLRLRSASSGGAILCLHGVTTPELPSHSDVHVPVARFKALIAAARGVGQLVPLQDLVRRHVAGRSTAGLVAITLDDAYASLLGEAADFVRREAIPLTVFVVAEAAAQGAAFWWDRIDDLFAQVSRARWRAFEDAAGLPAEYRNGQPPQYGPLRPLRQWVLATHAGRWPAALDRLLGDLEKEAGTRTRHRSMTFEELRCFAALPSVDIGPHSVSHPVFPLLPDAELRREITESYNALRERFLNVVPIVAVPFGLFDNRTVMVAREAGMTASLTLAGATLNQHQDRDDLPRFCVTRSETVFKLRLRLAGVFERIHPWRARALPRYPVLPSPTT
jgi:peptidoglycan/xylan/chitin deacetylase (PgdA/CDA1 family)